MTIINATHGELRWNGQKVAKVRDVSFDKARATLETTGIGELDDTYTYGKRTTSGSATLLYKSDDNTTTELMNRILNDNDEPDNLTMVLRRGTTQGTMTGKVFISSQGISNSVGDNTVVNISFVVSGKPEGRF